MMPGMDFEPSDRCKDFSERLTAFMDERVYPAEPVFEAQLRESRRPALPPAGAGGAQGGGARARALEPVPSRPRVRARAQQPRVRAARGDHGAQPARPGGGELRGAGHGQHGGADAVRHATSRRSAWLQPLLDGEIRSAFAMTEPDVASSDATNVQLRIERDGDEYVLNGRKWWTSGAMRERCRIFIVMGKTDPDGPPHRQQSMVLVPRDTPGVTVVRNLSVFGYADNEGHAELSLRGRPRPGREPDRRRGRRLPDRPGAARPGPDPPLHARDRRLGARARADVPTASRRARRSARRWPTRANIQDWIAEARVEIEMVRLLMPQDGVADRHRRQRRWRGPRWRRSRSPRRRSR